MYGPKYTAEKVFKVRLHRLSLPWSLGLGEWVKLNSSVGCSATFPHLLLFFYQVLPHHHINNSYWQQRTTQTSNLTGSGIIIDKADTLTTRNIGGQGIIKRGSGSGVLSSELAKVLEATSSSSPLEGNARFGGFECPECGMRTTYKSSLTRHMREKHTDRSFPCDLCGATYKWQASLYKHRRIAHGIGPAPSVYGPVGGD